MKILNSSKINERTKEYYLKEHISNILEGYITRPAETQGIVFDDPLELTTFADDFRKKMKADGVSITVDQSIVGSMLISLFKDADEDVQQVLMLAIDELIENSRLFHRGELEDNAYLKSIRFENGVFGAYEFSQSSVSKYELINYDTPKENKKGIFIPSVGTVDHRFRFPCVKKSGKIWMSLAPGEMMTAEQPAADARGKVLNLGCRMGYFAFMASEKDDVESVTIVESNPETIDLFQTHILPQFPHREKITVIEADAFDYMSKLEDGEYDFCFVDIWNGSRDIVSYLKMKSLCRKYDKMELAYWIDSIMAHAVSSYVYSLILEAKYQSTHNTEIEIPVLSDEEKNSVEFLRDLLKDVEIRKADQVDYYMDPDNIISMI